MCGGTLLNIMIRQGIDSYVLLIQSVVGKVAMVTEESLAATEAEIMIMNLKLLFFVVQAEI